jgi:hypothetical protein
MSFLGVELLFRGTRYILLGLMIVLVLSGVSNVSSNGIAIDGEIQALDVGGVDPPTIQWVYPADTNWSESTITGVHYDSVYTGQTERTWQYTSWISDPDGVDTVFFQYRHNTNDEWMNRTPSMVASESTNGQYSYTFVQEIWWDWESNWPQIEGGFFVDFRIFANDSLGNWRTTMPTFQDGGWMGVTPPWQYWIPNAIPYIITISAAVIVLIVVVVRRRRGTASVS